MRALLGRLREPDDPDHLLDVARGGVEAGPVGDRLAHGQVLVDARALQHDPHARAQVGVARRRVVAEHGDVAGAAAAVALEDLDRRRLARAVGPEQPEDLAAAHLEVDAADGLALLVGLVEVLHLDRGHAAMMARSSPSECSAPASTSGPTPRACWSPTSRTAALREVLQRRAFTRIGKGLKGGEIPREKIDEVARVVAEQRTPDRAARRRRDARRRDGGDPRGRQPGRVRGRDARRAAASRSRSSTARRRRAWPSSAPRARSASRSTARSASSTSAAARRSSRSARCPTGATWSESFRVGSGLLTDAYLRSDPPSVADLHAMREHAQGVFEGLDLPAVDAAVAVGGSAASLRRLVGAVLDAGVAAAGDARALGRPGRGGLAPLRDRSRARGPDARGADRARRGRRRRSGGRCRSAAAGCARASCSSSPRRRVVKAQGLTAPRVSDPATIELREHRRTAAGRRGRRPR